MKRKPSKFLEQHRITDGPMPSDKTFGNNGGFSLMYNATWLCVIASDQGGWDHVSVHAHNDDGDCVPRWDEMCYVKDLFFKKEECVLQYHPPQSDYVNQHRHVLHLWRPHVQPVPMPPKVMV